MLFCFGADSHPRPCPTPAAALHGQYHLCCYTPCLVRRNRDGIQRGGGGSTTIVGKSWRHFVQYCVVPKSVFDGGYRLPPPASDPSNRPMRSIPPVMLLLPPCLVRRNRDGREGWCPPAHRQLSTQVKMSVTVPMCANPSPCPTPGTGHGRQRYTTASSSSRAARSRRRSTRQRYRPLRSLSPPPPHPN